MKIRYEIKGMNLLTKCPHGIKTSINKNPVFVGSGICKECKFNVKTDKVFKYVNCIHEEYDKNNE